VAVEAKAHPARGMEKMATPVAAKEVAEAAPMVVDAGAPPG
jgi:hypothetical protein